MKSYAPERPTQATLLQSFLSSGKRHTDKATAPPTTATNPATADTERFEPVCTLTIEEFEKVLDGIIRKSSPQAEKEAALAAFFDQWVNAGPVQLK